MPAPSRSCDPAVALSASREGVRASSLALNLENPSPSTQKYSEYFLPSPLELRWCSLRLPAAPAALPLHCCACACGCGCGPRQLLHHCPSRTEKRKLPELTCELGLNPPGARTRAEPREKVHLMPAAGEENFAPRPESSAKMTGSRTTFASRG